MITVNTRTDDLGRTVEYPNATKWHTDADGVLHVIQDGKGNVGAHARGTWAYVKHEPPRTRNAVGDAVPDPLSPETLEALPGLNPLEVIERVAAAMKTPGRRTGRLDEDDSALSLTIPK